MFKSVGSNREINEDHYESNIENYDGRKRPGCSTRFIYDKSHWRFFGPPQDKANHWLPSASGGGDDSDDAPKKKKKKKSKNPEPLSGPPQAAQQEDGWGFEANFG